ncbi:AMP-binding protein [Mangrovicoccus ximenensis]|uniref:AMP-binding protein n=1 Tax=Mangrovicoccus ximenensis TaxID=1911570 RepID=UPI000D3C737D|nr:AMP-binding protein [Mangrovicoccus ximenensis]
MTGDWEAPEAETVLNMAHEAVDRHVGNGHGGETAMLWLGKDGSRREISYGELAGLSSRFADILARHGLQKGDSVFALAGRVPELYVAALGTLKAGLVFTPLFSAFGPEPIRMRMEIGNAKVLVTTEALYRRKVAALRPQLPSLELVLIIGGEAPEDCLALGPALEAASPDRPASAAVPSRAIPPRPATSPPRSWRCSAGGWASRPASISAR